ncbi:MAG: BsuBI/PstI family type II restriction endonuclease [Thermoguttaceae bacterium]
MTAAQQLRIEEAKDILQILGLPSEQQNERSALCLLAILNMTPSKKWADAENPLMGITPIMDWMKKHYGKEYAPNSRETIRRETMHQFVDAGLVLYNPDKPDRPTNSPKAVYQIEESALKLFRVFGKKSWNKQVADYMNNRDTLTQKYAAERKHKLVPLKLECGKKVTLSPGAHSELIKKVIDEFGPRFVPGGKLVYVGDTGEKWRYFDQSLLETLGIKVNEHAKMPDVVLFDEQQQWLFVVEVVTSHGPVNAKRRNELGTLFTKSSVGLVYVTAFPDRATMARYVSKIAWETEVWAADAPSHLIHFNGNRFLGPY